MSEIPAGANPRAERLCFAMLRMQTVVAEAIASLDAETKTQRSISVRAAELNREIDAPVDGLPDERTAEIAAEIQTLKAAADASKAARIEPSAILQTCQRWLDLIDLCAGEPDGTASAGAGAGDMSVATLEEHLRLFSGEGLLALRALLQWAQNVKAQFQITGEDKDGAAH